MAFQEPIKVQDHNMMANIENAQDYCCDRCPFTCKKIDQMKNHVLSEMCDSKSCPFNCKSDFSNTKSLNLHFKRAHYRSDPTCAPLNCERCDFSTACE